MLRLMFTCSHCDGAGVVNEEKLSPLQRRVLTAIRATRGGIKVADLTDQVYRGDENGGPDNPLLTIQATIRALNRRLKNGWRIVRVSGNKPYLRYRLVSPTEGERHAAGNNHRTIRRRPGRSAHHGEPAAREEK